MSYEIVTKYIKDLNFKNILLHNLFLKAVSLGWIDRNFFAFGFKIVLES